MGLALRKHMVFNTVCHPIQTFQCSQDTRKRPSRTAISSHTRVCYSGHLSLQLKTYQYYELCFFSWKLRSALSSGRQSLRFKAALEYVHYVHGMSKTSPTLDSVPTAHCLRGLLAISPCLPRSSRPWRMRESSTRPNITQTGTR